MVLAAEVRREIEIPNGVQLSVEGNKVVVTGKNGKLERDFDLRGVKIVKEEKKIDLFIQFPKKKDKAVIGTVAAHIKNMINGVTDGFEYKLKAHYSHFPMNISVEGDKVVVKNFLGEKYPRKIQIAGNAKVVVKGQDITVTGNNLEDVGQTAANLVQGTRVGRKDIRVFKDGIFIISKGEQE